MGTWGPGIFDNDTAADWAFGLEDLPDTQYIEKTLERVIATRDAYLEAPDAEEAISYRIPNKNQCKECHSLNGEVIPIGPKARNMAESWLAAMLEAWEGRATGAIAAEVDRIGGDAHVAIGAILEADRTRQT